MRIINKKYLVITLLVGVLLTGVIILKPKENVKLDNVILKQEVNNKTFAMYKETDNGYEEYKENNFPNEYVLNLNKSKCVDREGVEIEDALYTKDNKVGVRSNKSFYCYLYFDKSLGLEIKEKNPSKLSTDIKGAMYRFQGQAKDDAGNELVDNYICFGTSEKDKCVEDTDHYMYRIIGIEAETGRVKVIKMKALKQTYQWWDDYDTDIEFPKSKIYKSISGSDFLGNTDYIPKGWEDKISNNTWMYGDMWSDDTLGAKQTGPELYKTETGQKETRWNNYATKDTIEALSATVVNKDSVHFGEKVYYTNGKGNWTKSFEGKVSLMYLHDYHYSVSDTANCQYDENNYNLCQTSWIHLSQNDLSATSPHEWTMSRDGWSVGAGWFCGHAINNTGYTSIPSLDITISIRPVFFINAYEELLDGKGTIDNPFIIKNYNFAS